MFPSILTYYRSWWRVCPRLNSSTLYVRDVKLQQLRRWTFTQLFRGLSGVGTEQRIRAI